VYRYLIETKGCDVNARNIEKSPPLHNAFRYFNPNDGGNITVLMYLLNQMGINADIKDKCGETLLHYACDCINTLPLEIFRLLIETHGCDVNARDNNNDTPLHRAITYFRSTEDGGNITTLTYLLSQKGLSVNIVDRGGFTLLHYACQRINKLPLYVFKVLIEMHGGDVNVQNKNKYTPLYYALFSLDPHNGDDIKTLTYLFSQKDVNRNIKGWNGYTLLHYACEKINKLPLEIFKLLIETMGCDVDVQNHDQDTPIHCALVWFDPRDGGDISVLQYLFNQTKFHGDTNGRDGYTLLHIACEKINHLPLNIFKLLIEIMGCDVNAQNTYKNTPLCTALYYFSPNNGGDINVLTYLFSQKGLNCNINDNYHRTLLHMACMNINKLSLEIFKHLIETHGGDVNAQNKDKYTPLHDALCCFNPSDGGDINVLTYLFSQEGFDVNIKGRDGYTLLHDACDNINILPIEIFKLLIEKHGADVNARNDNKHTPLHNALAYFDPNDGGDINVLTYLLSEKIANLNIKGRCDHTLLHTACGNINTLPLDVFKVLIETHGCDINAPNDDNNTPLHCAFHRFDPNNDSNITVFAYLINQSNFNINIKHQCGHTFLHLACTSGISDLNNFSDPDDDRNVLEAKSDAGLSQIVEIIAERCVEQVFNESSS
jgi:ankyrin repeat protein